jgi:DNA-binding protein H-NS
MMADPKTISAATLAELSLPELKALQKKIGKAIDSYEDRQKQAALAELEAKAKEMGFSLSELTGQPLKGVKSKGAPRFAHPSDPSKTWTGKGRRPHWFTSALETGKSPDDLAL